LFVCLFPEVLCIKNCVTEAILRSIRLLNIGYLIGFGNNV
jgi:hypothetical protein